MHDQELFILVKDAVFIPVKSLNTQLRKSFEHDETDVVITHKYTRKKSKVIAQDAAEMIQLFETPKSLAEAVVSYASQTKKDPQQLAEEAFDLLSELQLQGFLVPFNENDLQNHKDLLDVGDTFKQYTVEKKLQSLDDSEVYKLADASQNKYALKLLKTNDSTHVSMMFKNEISILKKLDGVVNARLVEHGTEAGRSYLIIEWCEGILCHAAAEKLRNFNVKSNILAMLDMCVALLQAYSHIHKQGVLHGDIYPKNILIADTGAVKIIDFGISSDTNTDLRILRGGVCFYYEPELAAALLSKKVLPPITEKGEQYALAVLLYFLLTGRQYVHFSVEREKLLNQIVSEKPVSCTVYDLNLPVALDEVFSVALAKDPVDRFASLYDFEKAIADIKITVLGSPDYFSTGKNNGSREFISFLINKYGFNSKLIINGLSADPSCSVNYGAAGIAYMFYRAACVREDAQLLDLADVWANRAGNFITNYDHAFYSAGMGLNEISIGRQSIYHSQSGVQIVQSLISNCKGDNLTLRNALHAFVADSKKPCDKMDLSFGKVGLLLGCALLYNELETSVHFTKNVITDLANATMKEIWEQSDKYPPVQQKSEIQYFGIAHGWAGYLYATLFWCNTANQQLPQHFEKRAEELLAMAIQTDNDRTIRWPVSFTNKASWKGWCHGNAGYIFLWSLMYKHFKKEKFIDVAEKAAISIFNDTQNTNANLCCGTTGQAYALLKLYNVTGKNSYLSEANKIKNRIIQHIASPVLINNSLYKGEVGIGTLLFELERPEMARMPLFE